MKVVISYLLLVGGKIIDQELDLDSWQYVDWKRAIQCLFDEVVMSNHLTQEPPMDGTNAKWIIDNQRLLKLVCNTLTTKIEENTIHC